MNTKYEAGDQRLDNGFIKLELSFVTTFDEEQIITFQVADHEIENWNVKAFIWKHYEEIKCCRTDCCIPAAHRNSYLKRLMASKLLLLFFLIK